ncbi:MAG: hypothetical protein M0Z41_11155 [Peptococcaceae bacterium]|nr:hypothetical protein [Peptococcaceae bacterium]
MTGLLAHVARRLTSELSIMWTQHLYRCHDRYLEDVGRDRSPDRERLFA